MSIQSEDALSYQEKKSIAYLMSTCLTMVAYYIYAFQIQAEKSLATHADFKFWGTTILLIAPAMIIINIVVHVILEVVHAAANNNCKPESAVEDELDKLVEFRANRNAYATFMFGFLVAMATQTLGWPPAVMFNALAASIFVASLTWSSSQIYFYRKGF